MKKMVKDEYFNMDDKKWDELVEDGIKHGILRDTKECEQILEDMLSWDKLLPGLPLVFTCLLCPFSCYNWLIYSFWTNFFARGASAPLLCS